MKLSFNQVVELYNAMHAVSEEKETVIDGTVRMNLSINMIRLKPSVEAYSQARRSLELDGNKEKLSIVIVQGIEAQLREMAELEDEYNLKTIKQADLKLDSNTKISASVIAGLNAIIEDGERVTPVQSETLGKLKALSKLNVSAAAQTPTEA
jgi:hypothetical protein